MRRWYFILCILQDLAKFGRKMYPLSFSLKSMLQDCFSYLLKFSPLNASDACRSFSFGSLILKSVDWRRREAHFYFLAALTKVWIQAAAALRQLFIFLPDMLETQACLRHAIVALLPQEY